MKKTTVRDLAIIIGLVILGYFIDRMQTHDPQVEAYRACHPQGLIEDIYRAIWPPDCTNVPAGDDDAP